MNLGLVFPVFDPAEVRCGVVWYDYDPAELTNHTRLESYHTYLPCTCIESFKIARSTTI